ncbi:hypothetical protein [Riemerella columbipharyngis]|nr:hypothetical protein [Riemerella columbipharyngis]
MTTTEIKRQIEELKAGRSMETLKKEDKKLYYQVKGLSEKLSEARAYENKQFITKEDLVEYKALIIWMMKNKGNFRGYLNLKEAMQNLLDEVESGNIIYKTKKGIKGIVTKLALSIALDNSYNNMIDANGIDILSQNTYNNSLLNAYQQFKMNALM